MLLVAVSLADPASARPVSHRTPSAAPAPPQPTAKAWLLVDADTGSVLDGGNERTPLPPASLTKVMTAITVINRLPMTAAAPISARPEAAPPAQPVLAQIVATPIYYFPGPDNVQHRLTSHNRLFLTTYPGAIGVKTGFTDRAGACLIAAARRNGRTMLAVVLHGTNPTQMAG